MSIESTKPIQKDSMSDYPFSFDASKCEGCGGKCCIGESGYVFASIKEMQEIAAFLALSFESFCMQYVRKVGYRFSFLEKPYQNGLACVFFDDGKCGIYALRPAQCRNFPFWESHKSLSGDDFVSLTHMCAGIRAKKEQK
nr:MULTISPECIES: YkgJ family cysteine cluster protein [Helicobacter]